jgi:hypothetical protein
MYAYMYSCMHTCIHVCIHVFMYAYMYSCIINVFMYNQCIPNILEYKRDVMQTYAFENMWHCKLKAKWKVEL